MMLLLLLLLLLLSEVELMLRGRRGQVGGFVLHRHFLVDDLMEVREVLDHRWVGGGEVLDGVDQLGVCLKRFENGGCQAV